MKSVIRTVLLATTLSSINVVSAQTAAPVKIVVRTKDDLPRYTYPVATTAMALLTADDSTFRPFADAVLANVNATLAGSDIQDRATIRGLLGTQLSWQMLYGTPQQALDTIGRIRALEDKPDARLMSGLQSEALLKARIATGQNSGAGFAKAYADVYAASLQPLPWAVVGNTLKERKSNAQIMSETLLLGVVQQSIEPAVAKAHRLSQDDAAYLISLRQSFRNVLPVKDDTIRVLTAKIAANNLAKADIWAPRDVTLTNADKLTPVVVGIWDSGSDLSLFPGQTYVDPKPVAKAPYMPSGLAFDLDSNPSTGLTAPLDAVRIADYPSALGDMKGFSDLQASIESPEADSLKKKLGALPPDKVPGYLETLNFFGSMCYVKYILYLPR